jgi:hypothetical protein
MLTRRRIFLESLARLYELFAVGLRERDSRGSAGNLVHVGRLIVVIPGINAAIQTAPIRIGDLAVLTIRATFRRHPVARMGKQKTHAT